MPLASLACLTSRRLRLNLVLAPSRVLCLALCLTLIGCGNALGGDRAVPEPRPRDAEALNSAQDPATDGRPTPRRAEAGEGGPQAAHRDEERGERDDADRAPVGPGSGVVVGRLVDSVTSLPVADAVVALVEPDRRTITAPDGSFRFDGVGHGPVRVVFGPAPKNLPQSRPSRIGSGGLDLGLVLLPPSAASEWITPEYGGIVPGCGGTRLSVTTGALAEATELRLTCVDGDTPLPAPPPSGRLPLVMLDLAPSGLRFGGPAHLEVDLPPQPRFADGVTLDLLRLDLYRLAWEPAGVVTVTASGRLARGPLLGLGPLIVAAPPFGALRGEGGEGSDDRPGLPRYGLSAEAGGVPADEFGPENVLIYADFEYQGMSNTRIRITTEDSRGNVLFESDRPYMGAGSDSAPMVGPGGRWPPGRYHTNFFVGDPPRSAGQAVTWDVLASAPPPAGPRVSAHTDPSGASAGRGSSTYVPAPTTGPAARGGCTPPKGWFEYDVRAGDTLSRLAIHTGTDPSRLIAANCLSGPTILEGQRLLLPANPFSPVKPPAGGSGSAGPGQPGLPKPPSPGPAATPIPAKPRDPVAPTLAPRPTEFHLPSGAAPVARPSAAAPVEPADADAGARRGSPDLGSGSVPPTPEPTKARAPVEPTLAPRPTVPAP